MATKNQLTGGAFQDALGNPLAGGYLELQLSQDAVTSDSEQVAAGYIVQIDLDANGNVAAGQYVWPNDVLTPASTFYNVSAFTSKGVRVWGPNAQQVFSSPSPFDVGVWVPGIVNTLPPSVLSVVNVVLAPTASAGAATLPANPVAFLPININGTNYKIPLYAI